MKILNKLLHRQAPKGSSFSKRNDITFFANADEQFSIVMRSVEQSHQVVMVTDTQGIIEYVNPSFTELTGYSYAEAVGQNPRILKSGRMPPEIYEELWETIQSGQTWRGELYNRKKNGDLFWEECIISPISNSKGEIVHFLATKIDITSRRAVEDILEQNALEMKALYEFSIEINSLTKKNELRLSIVKRASGLVGCSIGELYLVLEDGETLELVAIYNLPSDLLGSQLKPGEGLAGSVLKNGQAEFIPDYSHWEGHSSLYDPYQYKRSLGVPLKLGNRVTGVIVIADTVKVGDFSEAEIRLINLFAGQAAIALENSRLIEVSNRRADQMGAVYRIAQVISSNLQIHQVIQKLYELCVQVLPLDVFYVAIYDEDSGKLEIPLFIDQGTVVEIDPASISESPGLTGVVIRQRRMLYLADTTDEETRGAYPIVQVGERSSRSYVGIPLLVRDRLVGVISMQNYEPYAYSFEQIRLLETIAAQAGIALENARLFEKMHQIAITDSLTSLYTRRHFFDLARIEMERSLRYKHPLSAIMLDLDDFKLINDTHGHTTGDQVLQLVAKACKETLRQIDIIGRYGGEEFVVILPETSLHNAVVAAERVRKAIQSIDLPFPMLEDKVIKHLTASFGVAELNCDHDSPLDDLLDRSDQAMYKAKQSGKNRVEMDAG